VPKEQVVNDRVKKEAEGPMRWIILHSKIGKKADAKDGGSEFSANPDTRTVGKTLPVKTTEAISRQRATKTMEPKTELLPAILVSIDSKGVVAEMTVRASDDLELQKVQIDKDAHTKSAIAPDKEDKPVEVLGIPLQRVNPSIPDHLLADNAEERIGVKFVVLSDGAVAGVAITHSSNSKINSYVVRAMSQWRYAPRSSPIEASIGFVLRGS
jgi:outer membrane biosynthesis protein TonB